VTGQNKANVKLQARLRQEIETTSLNTVALAYAIDTRTLAKYLANLPMPLHKFLGIELVVAMRQSKVQPPSSRSTEASDDGLRR
jgi:hypothetical protein